MGKDPPGRECKIGVRTIARLTVTLLWHPLLELSSDRISLFFNSPLDGIAITDHARKGVLHVLLHIRHGFNRRELSLAVGVPRIAQRASVSARI